MSLEAGLQQTSFADVFTGYKAKTKLKMIHFLVKMTQAMCAYCLYKLKCTN